MRVPLTKLFAGSSRIAGTWRSLTRAGTRSLGDLNPNLLPSMDDFTYPLGSLLRLAGWPKSRAEAHATLVSDHGARLLVIRTSALKLNQLLGEKITSMDLEVSYVCSGMQFDPAFMVDGFEEEQQQGGVVLCTTDLGMIHRGGSVVLKPKVVLMSAFDERPA